MKTSKRHHIFSRLTLLLGLLLCVQAAVAAPGVELRVDPASRSGAIEVGQKFYIKVIVSDISETPATPSNIPGAKLQYFGHQSSSSSIVSVNGQTTQKVVNIYAMTLKAEKKGTFSFGPITVGGVKSNTVSYTISEAGSAPQGGAAAAAPAANPADPTAAAQQGPTFIGKGNDRLFLRANISKTTAYEQEALVYTVKLYTTYGSIKFIGATDAPKFDGFVIEESSNVSNQLSYETYQGRTYATAIIARYIIFPQMAGELKIIGNKYTVSTDAEEYYHDPFFSQLTVRKPIQLNVTPNDLTVKVNPLPSPRPANFSGGVGKFTISSKLPSADAVANQAGSVSYLVTGEGNLKYIHLPDLNALYPEQIEVFSPTTDVKTVVGSSNVSGSINFDYSFMPMEAGTFTLPPVELVYFNPQTGRYETSVSKEYTLKVARGAESAKSQAAQVYNTRLMPVTLASSASPRPWVRGFAYWLWFIIPAILLGLALIGRRRYLEIHADVEGLRSRRAGKMARRRLKKAMHCIRTSNEDGFYDEMLRAIWGYLADKLKLPTSELNRENVSQILSDSGIPSSGIDSLVTLLDECEYAKYSPASARKPMQEVYDEGAGVLNTLEEEFAKAAKTKNETKNGEQNDDPII
ncbi:MAG: BatD family protein [Muribaculaceae bacterium]|nr:BatD family protein [Muribaculaceae bacterium]